MFGGHQRCEVVKALLETIQVLKLLLLFVNGDVKVSDDFASGVKLSSDGLDLLDELICAGSDKLVYLLGSFHSDLFGVFLFECFRIVGICL